MSLEEAVSAAAGRLKWSDTTLALPGRAAPAGKAARLLRSDVILDGTAMGAGIALGQSMLDDFKASELKEAVFI